MCALSFALLLPACISERLTPRRGVPIQPAPGSPAGAPNIPAPPPPAGPIAAPAEASRTLSSRVVVSIKPLGRIPYDGLSVPLVSPDGRFIAVQTGPAPAWSAVLAQPEPGVGPVGIAAGLAVYRITDSGLEGPGREMQGGLILGRSADDRGFLVESPRPDGSRWIGRIDWETGRLAWLIATPDVNAHAVLTAAGDLLFTRSTDGVAPASLVCLTAAGVETVWAPAGFGEAGLGAAFPLTGADPASAAVFLVGGPGGGGGGGRLQVVGLRLEPDARGGRQPVATAVARLAAAATASAAYQAAAPVQVPMPGGDRSEGMGGAGGLGGVGGVLVFEPGRSGGVVALFDPASGDLTRFGPGSIAAVPARDATTGDAGAGGFLVAGPRGLLYVPGTGGGGGANPTRPQHALSVVAGAYLPRATRIPGLIVLFGSADAGADGGQGGVGGDDGARGGFVYEVSVMLLGPDTGQPPAGPS